MIRVVVGSLPNLSTEGICAIVRDTSDLELAAAADDYGSLLEAASEHTPDVIILDIDLPGINQEGIVEDIKSICPAASVLLIADYRSAISLVP